MKNNVRFIATFENYKKEESGKKRNHVVRFDTLPIAKLKRLEEFILNGVHCDITIQRGYTVKCFTKELTDVTHYENMVIMSW